jgi:hypothetical protein
MTYKSNKTKDYDPETGCIRWLNEFSQYHNKILMDELKKLQKLHPNVSIIYADYYAAAMEIFVSPKKFGESKDYYAILLIMFYRERNIDFTK